MKFNTWLWTPERYLVWVGATLCKAEMAAPVIQAQVKGGKPFANLPKNSRVRPQFLI